MPTEPPVPSAPQPTEAAEGATRPPGEIGGHTVQPWEQDAVPSTSTGSKDVPPPSLGTPEARSPGPGAGAKTTTAPGNQPVGATPGHGQSLGEESRAPGGPTTDLPGSEGTEAPGTGAATAPPAQTRPPRPPVYKPQNGHEPAPRPTPAQVAEAKAQGPATDGDALVEAITKAIAENLAKALHQSIAQALRGSMPLSGRSVAQPKVEVSGQLRKAPPKPKDAGNAKDVKAGDAPAPSQPAAAAAAANPSTQPAQAASTEPGPSSPSPPSQPAPAAPPAGPATPADAPAAEGALPPGAKPSQYGGVIEPPTGGQAAGTAQK